MTATEKRIFRYRLLTLILDHEDSDERIKYAEELLKEIKDEVSES